MRAHVIGTVAFAIALSLSAAGCDAKDVVLIDNGSDADDLGHRGDLVDDPGTRWIAHFERGAELHPQAVVPTADGNVVIVGQRTPIDDASERTWHAVVKLQRDGTVLWQRTFETSYSSSLRAIETSDGSIVVVGDIVSDVGDDSDAAIFKLGADGELRWARRLAGPAADTFAAVAETTGGELVALGETWPDTELHGLLVARFDAGGDLLGQQLFQEPYRAAVNAAAADDAGNVFVVGRSQHGSDPTRGQDLMLLRLTSAGSIMWERRYFLPLGSPSTSALALWQGETLYVATSLALSLDIDEHLLAFSADGELLWQRALVDETPEGSELSSTLSVLAPTTSGELLMAGTVYRGDFDANIWLRWLGADGEPARQVELGFDGRDGMWLGDVASLVGGGVFLVGDIDDLTNEEVSDHDLDLIASLDDTGVIDGCELTSPGALPLEVEPVALVPVDTETDPMPAALEVSPIEREVTELDDQLRFLCCCAE
jgi:hypothetical protein